MRMNTVKSADGAPAPLEKIRVLDLGTMVSAPVAGTLLADFGAEVIKVEQPGVGDTLRGLGPFANGESLWWNVAGRNKKSITLNLRTAKGQDVLKRLVKKADVLIENFRPGTMSKWGLGYAELSAINPGVVVLSVSGFGQTGPYSNRAGYDRIALAFSGVMNLIGYPDRPPVRAGVSIADYTTALMGAYSVMLALYHRDSSGGRGQHIDLALYETMFRLSESTIASYDQLGIVRGRTGNVHYGAVPGNTFETQDGRYLLLTISSNTLFRRFCEAVDRPELADLPEYATHESRFKSVGVLNDIAAQWIKGHAVDKVVEVFSGYGLPFSLVLTAKEIVGDEQYRARENIVDVVHPRFGHLKMQGVVPKLSDTPGVAITAAPSIGQDNIEVYREWLNMSEQDVSSLTEEGVV